MANFPQAFANGMMVRGLPILQAQPGKVIWLNNSPVLEVGCVAGADTNRGTYYRPMATLAGAQAMCIPGAGDIIVVKPGHAETISSATALTMNVSDVAVVGLGGGVNRPQFTLDTGATSTINVTGDGISFQNCQFIANFANITALFTHAQASVTGSLSNGVLTVTAVGSGTLAFGHKLSATGLNQNTVILSQLTGTAGGVGTYQVSGTQTLASTTITTVTRFFAKDSCSIRDTSAALNFLTVEKLSTTDNASDGVSLTNSEIISLVVTGVVNLLTPSGNCARAKIAGNYYRASTTDTGACVAPIAAGKVLTDLVCDGNSINVQQTTGVTTGILITTNGTTNSGRISNNNIQGLDATTEILVTASSGFVFSNNWYSGAADKSGYLLPAADA